MILTIAEVDEIFKLNPGYDIGRLVLAYRELFALLREVAEIFAVRKWP